MRPEHLGHLIAICIAILVTYVAMSTRCSKVASSHVRKGDPMAGHSIYIDEDVFAELQNRAVPLVDDPNSVLRRVLGLSEPGAEQDQAADSHEPKISDPGPRPRSSKRPSTASAPKRRKRSSQTTRPKRAARGTLLPQAEYELPLLESLVELGGSGPASGVIDLVGSKLDGRLTSADRSTQTSGDVRWRNRVQFVRLGLVKEGLIARESPRGIWEITDSGRERLRDRANES